MFPKHSALALVSAALLAAPALAQTATATPEAVARMVNADGADAGTVTFNQTPSGQLRVLVEMTGLPPGPHGFHVHETGKCDPADKFESAGGHYTGGKEHGVMAADGPHAGDFPNVHVGQDGVLKVEFFTERLSIDGDNNPLKDGDGSAVLVHADPDDYAGQPSGHAGHRLACGVVE